MAGVPHGGGRPQNSRSLRLRRRHRHLQLRFFILGRRPGRPSMRRAASPHKEPHERHSKKQRDPHRSHVTTPRRPGSAKIRGKCDPPRRSPLDLSPDSRQVSRPNSEKDAGKTTVPRQLVAETLTLSPRKVAIRCTARVNRCGAGRERESGSQPKGRAP